MVCSTLPCISSTKIYVAQCVGHINALLLGINGDSGGTLEKAFAALQAADDAFELSMAVEDKDLSRIGIGDIDIVLLVDSDALRSAQRVFAIRRVK